MADLHCRRRAALTLGVTPMIVTAMIVTACADPGVRPDSVPATTSSADSVPSAVTAANVYERQRAEGVTRLLAALTEALVRGTPTDLDALIDPAASPEFRDRLSVAADNLGTRLVPRELRYELAPTEEAEKLVGSELSDVLAAQGSSDTWVAPVQLRYALGGAASPGVDEPEVTVGGEMVFARYADDWKVVGDAVVIGGPPTPTQLWEIPELAVADVSGPGGTSVIASYPGTEDTAADLVRLLPGAIAAVSAFWGTDWPRRAVVVATAADGQFNSLTAGGPQRVAAAAAATVYTRIDTSRRLATGQRVILTPAALELPAPTLAVVLRHEITHVATRPITAVDAPMWITEGVPEYVGRKGTYTRIADAAPDLTAAIRDGELPTDLPIDAAFAVGADGAQLAYQQAWSVGAFVADRFGESALRELYRAVASAPAARTDAAIESALDISRAELVQRWRSWLTRQLR